MLRAEMSLARWKRVPPQLKHLAVMAAAVTVGCAWCVDFGYWVGEQKGVDARKVRDVPRWRESNAYTDLERRVIAYAEAMSLTPPAVTDEMVAALRADLDDAQLVELTMMIAVENQRSRFNTALGLTAQGFQDRCEVPA
jgi:AhpD family alkylhydroperoxidase